MSALVHGVALAVAVDADGPHAGALIIGRPGSGKSSLAIGVIAACPYRRSALVADDAVLLDAHDGALTARAPETIAGLIEVFGFGPVVSPRLTGVRLAACFDLDATAERLPSPSAFEAAGASIPLYPFDAGRPAAAFAFCAIMRAISGGQS